MNGQKLMNMIFMILVVIITLIEAVVAEAVCPPPTVTHCSYAGYSYVICPDGEKTWCYPDPLNVPPGKPAVRRLQWGQTKLCLRISTHDESPYDYTFGISVTGNHNPVVFEQS